PATSDVTGQRSNQLNYDPAKYKCTTKAWWAVLVSNQRPHPCKGCALPPELTALREQPIQNRAGIYRAFLRYVKHIRTEATALLWFRSTAKDFVSGSFYNFWFT